MFSNVKKAAATLHAGQSGHAELSMAIYQEKCVQEALTKLIETRRDASSAWLQYANSEKSEAARELFLKMHSIDTYWIKAYEDYYSKYECYRGHFQQILKGERSVDDAIKEVNDYNPKITKVQKQIDALGAKGKDKKYDALSTEKGKYLSLQLKAQHQLDQRRENHSLFKYKNIKDAVKLVTDAQIELHERCFEIFQTQRLLLDYFTATTYSSISSSVISQAKTNGKSLLDELERKIGFGSQGNRSSGMMDLAEPSQEILDEVPTHSTLADIFGNSQIPGDNEATYNPIPEMDTDLILEHRQAKTLSTLQDRPLPALPPTAPGEEVYKNTVDAKQQNSHPVSYQNTKVKAAAPPVPPRKDLIRDKGSGKDGSSKGSGKEGSSKGSGKEGSSRNNSHKSLESQDSTESAYLEMSVTNNNELRPNSLYESADKRSSSSYFLLKDTYSGSRGSSTKSTGSSSSRGDSGLESRGSVKSNTSHFEEEEDIYEVLDGRNAVPKKFSDIKKDNLYEL